jgi:hypothetical protein
LTLAFVGMAVSGDALPSAGLLPAAFVAGVVQYAISYRWESGGWRSFRTSLWVRAFEREPLPWYLTALRFLVAFAPVAGFVLLAVS